ncbi:hypothetical protein [Streptococcus moroccensis]|uniref:Elongation factor Tu n=1 Tax=Streptococcus moroccensis TaxID=1451356 RepID=A0ABT9YP55_9STRE|nr:hypothetical protein [Streptococcus moroccensis]MDQ0221770.1 hypothetical protein [Streptococcus moroccensis]
MKSIYAYETIEAIQKVKPLTENLLSASTAYKAYLAERFQLFEPAEAVVWTTAESAMTILSQNVVPAYNNGTRIVISPDVREWQSFFLEGFAPYSDMPVEVLNYYKNLSESHVKQVFFHELTHDCDIFGADYDSERDDLWFEEGMCEYISRYYLLSNDEFLNIKQIEELQVAYFETKLGHFNLESFDQTTYEKGQRAYLMSFYAKAFIEICHLVEAYGSLSGVLERYQKWWGAKTNQTLYDWLHSSLNKKLEESSKIC